MPQFLFALGRESEISIAEIESVFASHKITYNKILPAVDGSSSHKHLIITTPANEEISSFMAHLGGTIKIGKLIELPLKEYLNTTQPTGKIVYSISGDNSKSLALTTKKELKVLGRSVRYIEPKNTATILHNNLVEKQGDFTILNKEIYCTIAIQPIEDFSERDYGRPNVDGKSGMLPPKLARIMINLAEAPIEAAILDPFCGSGTILSEALSMGYNNLIGSDNAEKAVRDTKKNLAWLQDKFPPEVDQPGAEAIRISNQDATKINLPLNSIDAIITEPYLGKPLRGGEPKIVLEQQVKDLRGLYVQSFRSFHKILKPGGVVVFIIPSFKFQNTWIQIPCVEEIKKIGFTPISFSNQQTSLLYSRPDQHVGRNIWRFKKITA